MPDYPKITVLMPVYNGEKYLKEAIDSILSQTFKDFEFLIINDGSTDRSVEIIKSCNDSRIRLVENGENIGLIATLNKGIDIARGKYIARMDQDDISLPERLVKQVVFMEAHPEVGVCGSWISAFSRKKRTVIKYPADHDKIRCFLFYNPGIAHPAAMIRKNIFMEHNLFYDGSFIHAEDYELWTRAIRYARLANIPEVLISYRISEAQITHLFRSEQLASAARVREGQLLLLGLTPSAEERSIHEFIMSGTFERPQFGFSKVYSWVKKIERANKTNNIFFHRFFLRQLRKTLLRMILIHGYYWSRNVLSLSSLSKAFRLGRKKQAGPVLDDDSSSFHAPQAMKTNQASIAQQQTVLYVDHSPKIGGAAKVLLHLIQELDAEDVRPIVVCPASSDMRTVLTDRGISVAPAFMPWFTKRSGPVMWCVYTYAIIAFAFFLGRLIRATHALLIHANSFIAAIYSIIPSKLLKVPLIWHAHEILELGFVNGVFIRIVGRNADRIICVSQAVKRRLIEFGLDGDKCAVVYNFMPKPEELDIRSQRDVLSEYHIPGNARIIGVIGNISALKGQIIFIEAIRRIAQKHPDVFYFIVGDTQNAADEPYKKELLRVIRACGFEKKVILTGYRTDAFRILDRFDFLVHPVTLPDSFPLVIQEAMYHGKAVIASNIGGIPEMIVDRKSGFLVPPGDSNRLAEAIHELLIKPHLSLEFGKEGKRILSAKFGRDEIISSIKRIYWEVIPGKLNADGRSW